MHLLLVSWSSRRSGLSLMFPELCSAKPFSPGVNFDSSNVFPTGLYKQHGHLLGSSSTLPQLASLPAKAWRVCCYKVGWILLTGEVAATQAERPGIRKRSERT